MNFQFVPNRLIRRMGVVFAVMTALAIGLFAYSNGITGRTSTTSSGCGGCHGGRNTATTVTATSSSGSFTVQPGSTTTFTVTVSNSNTTLTGAGVDIAVKTDQTGTTNAGTLAASGSDLRLSSGELTHTSPKAMSGGSSSFSFTWTAPTTAGTFYLRATGIAVNEDGNADNSDEWNWMTPQAITVASAAALTLTSPMGGQSWCSGSSQNITWTSSGITNVKIDLSSDGGATYPTTLIASTAASAGSWAWNIPANQSAGTSYRIRISDVSNSATSSASTSNFSIATGTSITAQPQSVSACTGTSVTFSVSASGNSLSYQWQKNAVNISGATSSSYTIPSVAAGDAGSYAVIISGACGSPLTSNTATLTVGSGITITGQPQSLTACTGTSASFSVSASGGGISYQWRKNSVNISGATQGTYNIASVAAGDAGSYDCVVTSSCGSPVTSSAAVLTVGSPAVITSQPQSVSACVGQSATFSITATGTGATYQWLKNSVNIPGATSPTYNIAAVSASDAGSYFCDVTVSCGVVVSNTATLSVGSPPAITSQPASQTVNAGANVSFTVVATGGSLTYQWQKNSVNISGQTSATLSLNSVSSSDAGNYDCIVSNGCSSVTSSMAQLIVNSSAGAPVLAVSSHEIEFGTIRVGQSMNITRRHFLMNTGTGTLTISSISFSGSGASSFSVVSPSLPATIAAGQDISITVRFRPSTRGDKEANMNFSSNTTQSSPVVEVSGRGGNLRFGRGDNEGDNDQTINFNGHNEQRNDEQTFSITNIADFEQDVTLAISGDNAADFTVISPESRQMNLLPGESKDVTIMFNPYSMSNNEQATLVATSVQTSETLTLVLVGQVVETGVPDILQNNVGKVTVYPNPASDNLVIEYNVNDASNLTFKVYDMMGNTMATFIRSAPSQGTYTIEWDGKDSYGRALPSGAYLLVIESNFSRNSYPILINR